MSISDVRAGSGVSTVSTVAGVSGGHHCRTLSQDRSMVSLPPHYQERSRAKSRSRGLADIDPKFISQVIKLLR